MKKETDYFNNSSMKNNEKEEDFERSKIKWNENSAQLWFKYYLPPNKPSENEINRYREIIDSKIEENQISKPIFYILGSTPEFIKLALSYPDSRIFVFDNSEEYYRVVLKLNELENEKRIQRENVSWQQNWANIFLPPGLLRIGNKLFGEIYPPKADIILGDLVLGNLNWQEEVKGLIQNLKFYSKKTTVILMKNMFYIENISILDEYLNKYKDCKDYHPHIVFILPVCLWASQQDFNKKIRVLNLGLMYQKVQNLKVQNPLFIQFKEYIKNLGWKDNKETFNLPTMEQWEVLLEENNLKLVSNQYNYGDPYDQHIPIQVISRV